MVLVKIMKLIWTVWNQTFKHIGPEAPLVELFQCIPGQNDDTFLDHVKILMGENTGSSQASDNASGQGFLGRILGGGDGKSSSSSGSIGHLLGGVLGGGQKSKVLRLFK